MGFLHQAIVDELDAIAQGTSSTTIKPARGVEMFDGTDYPHEWDGFIGQASVKEQLRIQVASSTARNDKIEHTLLATGQHGVGKTTLAHLLAYQRGVGLLQTSGPLTVEEAKKLMKTMSDHDILFIDEGHKLVDGGRNKADWLLPFMTEGKTYTQRGAEVMPDITIVLATTDVGKLPETLISRFMVQPEFEAYTAEEAIAIVGNLTVRMNVDLDEQYWDAVAVAADTNPRSIRRILIQIRDLQHVLPETHPNLEKALKYAGLSPDGLTVIARQMMSVLLVQNNHQASIETIRGQLGEPGPLKHHEQVLLRRRYIEISGQGRRLTARGEKRAREEHQ